MSDTAGPSSSTAESGETGVDVAVEAAKLLGQGRRHLLVGDAPAAVQALQESCGLLATKYGETGDELGEAYFHYGAALLELGRMESGVLGNALDGVPDAATDDSDEEEGDDKVESAKKVQGDERDKVIKEVDEALESICDADKKDEAKGEKKEEKNDESKKDEDEKMDTGNDEKQDEKTVVNGNKAEVASDEQAKEKKEDAKNEKSEPAEDSSEAKTEQKEEAAKGDKKEDGKVEGEKKDEGAGPSTADDKEDGDEAGEAKTDEDTAGDTAEEGEDGEKDEGDDGEDVPNFQLCWEILELARVIFGRKDDKEFKLKVSQVHLKLGELGLETEQYSQSIDDFTHCLNIQKEHLEPESRLLAETQYNLGLANVFDKRFSDAIDNFEGAKKVIESRIAKLEKRVKENEGQGKGKEKADAEDPVVQDQKEIAELQDLLPEITAKLEDAKDTKKSSEDAASQAIAAAAAEFGLGAGSSSSSSSAFGAPSSSSEPAKPIQVRKAGASGEAAPADISHLVRRKRKPEEEASEGKEADDATEAKRSKPDEAGDATSTANGHAATVNGHAAQNGHASLNGHDISPDKQEVKPKTVEKKVNGDAAPAPAMETA